jgi:hypothetical protein
MPKPRQGSQVKEHQSIRLEPKVKEELRRKFGSVQAGIDFALKTIEEQKSGQESHETRSF